MHDSTELLYLTDMHLLHDKAIVVAVEALPDNRHSIILDRTILYPQGGGQPYDMGTITADGALFKVSEVRFLEGIVYHKGTFEAGMLTVGQPVKLQVDGERRLFMSRLHSAGHLIDFALQQLGIDLVPAKAYHFPDGPYVEYEGSIAEEQREELKNRIQQVVDKMVADNIPVTTKLMEKDALAHVCKYIPDTIPTGKPTRVMLLEGVAGIPCGGMHVKTTKAIARMTITAVKGKKGNTRISYALE